MEQPNQKEIVVLCYDTKQNVISFRTSIYVGIESKHLIPIKSKKQLFKILYSTPQPKYYSWELEWAIKESVYEELSLSKYHKKESNIKNTVGSDTMTEHGNNK